MVTAAEARNFKQEAFSGRVTSTSIPGEMEVLLPRRRGASRPSFTGERSLLLPVPGRHKWQEEGVKVRRIVHDDIVVS